MVAGQRLDEAHAEGSGPVTLGVRPEDVILEAPGSGILEGTIDFTEPYGGVVIAFISLQNEDGLLQAREHIVASVDVHQPLVVGARVGVGISRQPHEPVRYRDRQGSTAELMLLSGGDHRRDRPCVL